MGAKRPIVRSKSQVERLVRAAKPSGPNGRPDAVGQLAVRAALRRANAQDQPRLLAVGCILLFADHFSYLIQEVWGEIGIIGPSDRVNVWIYFKSFEKR